MEKAYSIDGDTFPYKDPSEAMEALSADERLVEGEIYYECDIEGVRHADYLKSSRLLESASELICADVGEVAEQAFRTTQAAKDELDALVGAWCAKHFAWAQYWRCRGRSRELKVTAADVAEYAP